MHSNNSRLLWVDLLRIFSIYAVIVIHVAAPYLNYYSSDPNFIWWVGNFYDSLARWCIPVFLMLSGAFILEKVSDSSIKNFLIHRFQRVLLPFFFWSFLYFLWRIYVDNEEVEFYQFFSYLIKEPIYYHLWFIYVLIPLYLLSPVFSAYFKGMDQNNLFYFLFLWIIYSSILPIIEKILGLNFFISIKPFDSFFYYTGYFILGYVLRTVSMRTIHVLIAFLIFISSVGFTFCGTFLFSDKQGKFDETLYQYVSPNIVIMSITLLLIIKNIHMPDAFYKLESQFRVFEKIALCVPGIYFIHAMIISFFKREVVQFNSGIIASVYGIPLYAAIVFVSSLIIILILKQIPLVNNVIS